MSPEHQAMTSDRTNNRHTEIRKACRLAPALTLLGIVAMLPLAALPQQDSAGAGIRGLLDFLGFNPGTVASMAAKPKVVELEVRDKSRQASFAGLVRLPDSAEKFFQDPTSPPPFIKPTQVGYFSEPARETDLGSLELAEDDYEVLAECKPAKCRFKLDILGIEEAESIDWKAAGAHAAFLDWFRAFLVQTTAAYRARGVAGLITYADKKAPYPVARGLRSLQEVAIPALSLYPALQAALAGAPQNPSLPGPEGVVSDRMMWSVSDFGYRPTLSLDRVVVTAGNPKPGLGPVMASQNIYANHYLAGRLQLGGILRLTDEAGQKAEFFWLLDQILFDDELGGLKRSLLARGLKSEVEDRLAEIRARRGSPP